MKLWPMLLSGFILHPVMLRADEPKLEKPAPKVEQQILPAPKQVFQQNLLLMHIYPERGPEHGSRDVWQLYSVDYRGMFRPRVIMVPPHGEAFYLYDGRPYPWMTTDSLPYMPYSSP